MDQHDQSQAADPHTQSAVQLKCFVCGQISSDPYCKTDGMLTETMCHKCKECKSTCICKPKTI